MKKLATNVGAALLVLVILILLAQALAVWGPQAPKRRRWWQIWRRRTAHS